MVRFVLVFLTFGAAGPVAAGPVLEALPADAHLAVWWRLNPERSFLGPHLERVVDAARAAGLGAALQEAARELAGARAAWQIGAAAAAAPGLLSTVSWRNAAAEGALSLTFGPSGLAWVLVVRPRDPARAVRELGGLARFLAGPAAREREDGGVSIAVGAGRTIEMGRFGSHVVLASSPGRCREAGERAQRGNCRDGLWANPAWQRAAEVLPPPEDTAFFIDLPALVRALRQSLLPPARRGLAGFSRDLLAALEIERTFACAARVSWTDGPVLRSRWIARLGPNWRDTPLGRCAASLRPEAVPFGAIPPDAVGVSFRCAGDPGPVLQKENL